MKHLKRLIAIDWLVIAYISSTFLFILVFYNTIPEAFIHLVFRIILLTGILAIPLLDRFHNLPVIRFVRIAYPLAIMAFFYAETDALNNVFSDNLDYHFARWDAILFGIQPSLEFSKLLPQLWFSELMNLFYVSYYFLITGFFVILSVRNKPAFMPAVFVVTCSFFIYYILYILIPVGGPQYFFEPPYQTIPDSGIFRIMVKLAEHIGERPTAAFPSSHVGIVLILILIAMNHQRKTLWWLLPFFAGICFSTVYIKAHFAIDILAGIISAPLIYAVSLLIWRKIKPSVYSPQP